MNQVNLSFIPPRPLLRWTVASLLLAGGLAGCGFKPKSAGGSAPAKPPTLVVPARGAYTGAYIEFGDKEDDVTLDAIESFEAEVGKHQAIVAFSSFWGEDHFPTEQTHIVDAHGSIPLVFWSPWDWPYREDFVEVHGPDKFRLDQVLAGRWDPYIDRWADEAKAFGRPLFVSLCNESNGNWFPWSAVFYGGGEVVPGSNPPRYAGPELFKKAYRYVVDRVRARGASNILWVLHLNNYSEPYEPWNMLEQFYPGDGYVDWLGLSVYGQMYPDERWATFEDMIDKPYEEICRLNATKPVMVTEWGVGEFPAKGNKGQWIDEAFARMQKDLPRVKAAVYWHERWQNNGSLLYSNLKLNSSPESLAAYRRHVAAPYWLDAPVYQ